MCIICVKKRGVELPTEEQIRTMFTRNSHGGGYMYARNGKVECHKGFMNVEEMLNSIKEEKFTNDDVVAFHFRIGTQGANSPQLTHPYPYTEKYEQCFHLDYLTNLGIMHNGIIPLTSTGKKDVKTNDTIDFITQYLVKLIRTEEDLFDKKIHKMIESLTNSKWCLMNGKGDIITIGNFIEEKNGLLFSNNTYKEYKSYWYLEDDDDYYSKNYWKNYYAELKKKKKK